MSANDKIQDINKQIEQVVLDYQVFEQEEIAKVVARKQAIGNELESQQLAFLNFQKTSLAEVEELDKNLQDSIQMEKEKCDQTVISLQQERDKIALSEKLNGFPPELVEKHKNCMCGAEMRPFQFADGRKAWGCQNGEEKHDWIWL